MTGRRVDRARHIIEGHPLAERTGEIGLCGLGSIRVFLVRGGPTRSAFHPALSESRLQDVGAQLQSRDVGPKMFERLNVLGFRAPLGARQRCGGWGRSLSGAFDIKTFVAFR